MHERETVLKFRSNLLKRKVNRKKKMFTLFLIRFLKRDSGRERSLIRRSFENFEKKKEKSFM